MIVGSRVGARAAETWALGWASVPQCTLSGRRSRFGKVSYDLAVWEGERPASDEIAEQVFTEFADVYLESDEPPEEPPTPAIQRYIAALLQRWPDIDSDAGDASPWAVGPLISDASGPFFYFPMVWSMAEEASEYAARLAAEHGLVCFDPQVSRLRP